MRQLSWKPVRRGHIYCSSACGSNCTRKSFKEAHKKAKALAKHLGAPWKPRVWENMGWHWEVYATAGLYFLTLWGCKEGSYTCAISGMPGAGLPGFYDCRSFITARAAIRASVRIFRDQTKGQDEALKVMRKMDL